MSPFVAVVSFTVEVTAGRNCSGLERLAMTDLFSDISFASNPDPRCPVVLVLDVSGSMGDRRPGEETTPIAALSRGLDVLVSELSGDALARRRVEVAIVTFGSAVTTVSDFATVDSLVLPHLVPDGVTPMGEAVERALDMVEERKRTYRANGVAYYRPWVMLITDGLSTDDVTAAAARIKAAEADKRIAFFAVAVDGADMAQLSKLSSREPMSLQGTKFAELFVWLSASQSRVSSSNPGDKVALPSPAGWAEV